MMVVFAITCWPPLMPEGLKNFSAAYAIAFLGSALVGRPVIGFVYGLLSGQRGRWRQEALLRHTLTWATFPPFQYPQSG